MPVDHFSLIVPASKVEGVVSFLLASMQHLGFKEHMRFQDGQVVGLGEAMPYFWIAGCPGLDEDDKASSGAERPALRQQHVAFSAQTVEQVRQFHDAAIKAGGVDNGPPGPRPQYHPGYYGAFVRDPHCGVNFEVVMHTHSGEK